MGDNKINYQKIYDSIIYNAQQQSSYRRESNNYHENHHILPKCMGGTDELLNLVLLTPEEHYVAHQLLIKIYDNPKLIYAVIMMSGNSTCNKGNNKLYGWLRRKVSVARSKSNIERFKDPEERRKISDKLKGRELSDYQRKRISESNRARAVSHETKEKISNSLKGKPCSEETKEKRRKNQTGRKYPPEFGKEISERQKGKPSSRLVICPHCNKEGRLSGMIRWHFDNCPEHINKGSQE